MDIILTDSAIRKFLETSADSDILSRNVSLCGPTFDRVKKIDGDYIYDIEVITNRVDTASAQGVAREAAIILTQFNIPAKLVNDPYQDKTSFPVGLAKHFHFNIGEGLVFRFTAISLENISVKPSPKETKIFLENCGQRSLNNCVDITNELTLLYGMPSHIFDLDKLAAQSLTLRESQAGETITTLDDKANRLAAGDIVIEDGSGRLVDLCGVMGGQVAEVDDHTKRILLIVPVYYPQKIRQTSLALQKRTLAAQLYEKQPDPELCLPVISKAIQLFKERAGAEVSSSLFDYYPVSRLPKIISLDFNWLNSFVGIDFQKETVITILASLGFGGKIEKDHLICTVPSWRYHDINLKEDLAEEVARIYGYFRLPSVLPCVNLPTEPKNILLDTELKVKKYLANVGFHEIYNSSLISEGLLEKTEQNPSDNIKLKNSLSTDFEYLRTCLIPSGLENLKHSQGKIETPLKTFEVANVYQIVDGQELPREVSTLALLSHDNFRNVKGTIESLLEHLKVKNVSFKPVKQSHPFFNQSATAAIFSGDHLFGHLGLLRPSTLRNIGLQTSPVAVEINLETLVSCLNQKYIFQPISEYPYILENITVNSQKLLGDIVDIIKNTSRLIKEVQYLESFHTKHTFRVSFGSNEKNLEQKEVNALKDIIQERFKV